MKKPLILFLFLVLLLGTAATLSATVTWTVPGTYPTLGGTGGAIEALNAVGIVGDDYVIDVAPGYTETLTGRITLTATGTATYSITIQRASAGTNPLLTAYVGTGGSAATADGMFALAGSDYVIIDGIDLYDPNTASNTTMMEYGYGLFKAAADNGAQYNTIKNCTVTLNRNCLTSAATPVTEGSACITVLNSLVTTPTISVLPTTAGGTNSYNKFYSNYLTNANYGIVFNGYAAASPFTLGDTGNDVGGGSTATGNQIINFGGGTGATVPSAAIRGNNQWAWNASYNTIDNNNGSGVNHPNTLRGIFAQAGTSASCNINYNTVSIKGGGTTSQLSAIECTIGSTAAGNMVNINNNTVENCSYASATTGSLYLIYATSTPATLNMNYNKVRNNSLAGTGGLYGVYSTGSTAANTLNINYNEVYSNTKTGASGLMHLIRASTTLTTISYNQIYDNAIPNSSGPSASTLWGIYNGAAATYESYHDNQIYNLSIGGASTSTSANLAGIYTYTTSTGNSKFLNNNLIYNLQYNATAGSCVVYGVHTNIGGTVEIAKNKIHTLYANTGTSVVAGVQITSGTTHNVQNNMIWGLSAVGSTSSAASPAVVGIRLTGGTTNNVHYNSVLLSYNGSNAYYSNACLYMSAGTTNTIRNNIFSNKSEPGTNGRIVGIWKTSAGTINWGTASDKNIYWVGDNPDAAHCVAYYVTTAYPTLAEWKAAIGSGDQGSYYENVPFVSDRVVDLHIDDSVPTRVEGNAVTIVALCDDDIDGDNRSDTAPDIGADEGDFLPVVAAPGEPVYSSPGNGSSGIAIDANLVWSANSEGGTPTSYEVYFGETLPSLPTATVYTASYSPAMQYNRTYSWKIVAINAQGSAEGLVWTFTTMDDPNFYVTGENPYLMDFEEITTAGALPQYWTKSGTKWTTMTTVPSSSAYNRGPRSGTDYATCAYSSTTTDWLFSRPIHLDASQSYDFGMWYNTDGYSGWTSFKMYIGTTATGAAMTTELASVLNPTNMSYAQLTRNAWQPPATGTYYIGFQVISNTTPWYMSFDDFTVVETPTNPVFSISPTSKDFGLKNVFTQTDQLFTITNAGMGTLTITEILLEGDNCFSFVTPPTYPIELNSENPPATFTVRYSPTEAGSWSGNVKITDDLPGKATIHNVALLGTSFDPILPIPYPQDFNAGTTLPTNWSQSTSAWIIGSTHGRTGNGIYKNLWSSAPTGWFQTQPIGPISASTRLSFYYRLLNYTDYPGVAFTPGESDIIRILVSTDEGGTFSPYGEINSTNHTPTTAWTEKQIWLSGAKANANDRIVLRFEAFRGSGDWYIDIDDIMVEHVSAEPVFDLSPLSKDYGPVQIGTSSIPQTYTIKNIGGGTLSVGGIELVDADMNHYILENLNPPTILLGSGMSATVSVTFHPATVGTKNARLKVVDNTNSTTNYAALTGVGVDETIYELPYIQALNGGQAPFWKQRNIGAGLNDRWSISTTSNAGGMAPEWHCLYQNITGTTRLISPPISVTGLSELVVKYKQQIDDYGTGCEFKLRYGYNIDSFFDIWTQASASNTTYPAEEKTFVLGPELQGHDVVYLCWEVTGNLNQFDHWYIDNIKFLTTNTQISEVVLTGPVASINVPEIMVNGVPTPTSVQFTQLPASQTVSVWTEYAPALPPLQNVGLVFHIDAGAMVSQTLFITHNLGFIPQELAYSIGGGDWIYVQAQQGWNPMESFFDVFFEPGKSKGPNSITVAFPLRDDESLPVELSSFTALLTAENFVSLSWVTQSESGVQGYYIYRSASNALVDAQMISPLIDATNTTEQHTYQFIDNELTDSGTYYYWLQNVDYDGTVAFHGPVSVFYSNTGSDPVPEIPLFTELKALYPNPFNPILFIPYSISKDAKVEFKIYNSRGQLLRHFDLGTKTPGNYRIVWNGTDSNGAACGNGIYYIVMQAGKDSFNRKAVLLK